MLIKFKEVPARQYSPSKRRKITREINNQGNKLLNKVGARTVRI